MKLFAQPDAAAFIKTGAKEFRFNRDIRLTPGAKDAFTEAGVKVVFDAAATGTPAGATPAAAGSAPAATKGNAAALFNSPEAAKLKADIVEIGRRCWIR